MHIARQILKTYYRLMFGQIELNIQRSVRNSKTSDGRARKFDPTRVSGARRIYVNGRGDGEQKKKKKKLIYEI